MTKGNQRNLGLGWLLGLRNPVNDTCVYTLATRPSAVFFFQRVTLRCLSLKLSLTFVAINCLHLSYLLASGEKKSGEIDISHVDKTSGLAGAEGSFPPPLF